MSQLAISLHELVHPAERDRPASQADAVPTALLAECTCPDWCERDHDRD